MGSATRTMSDPGWFDCDVGVGKSGSGIPTCESPGELLATLDRYRIDRALCYDLAAVETGAFGDYDRILDFCSVSDRLIASIPVAPPACAEQPDPHRLVELMRETGIGAVGIWPEVHHFDLASYALAPLLEALSSASVPLVYHSRRLSDHPWEHRPDWHGVIEIADGFPDLELLVLYTGMLQGRRVFPILDSCPHVTIDLTCQTFGFVEEVVSRYGSDRLVCASHLPFEDPALFGAWLPFAGISDEERAEIAHGNAERLFARPVSDVSARAREAMAPDIPVGDSIYLRVSSPSQPEEPGDRLRDLMLRGAPVDSPFIDVHTHFGRWSQTTVPHSTDTSRLIAEMDRYGCDQIWVCASEPGMAGGLADSNDEVFAFADAYPGRVLPYCTLSANDPDGAVEELSRCLTLGPCVGVKMHRYRQRPYTMMSRFLQPVFELLEADHLVYLNHQFVDHSALMEAAARYPTVTFLSGHGVDAAIGDLAAEYPNILDCTCAAQSPNEIGEEVARLGRSDTLLVGSDFGVFNLGFGIGPVAFSTAPEHAQRAIIGGNALRLLTGIPGLCGIADDIAGRYRGFEPSEP